ncbi:phosphatase [Papillibacter cinnamivorans]|nr:phosphatase [Papillibacter cinnamivorans]
MNGLIYGIIDLGSNTIRLSIYRREGEETRLLLHKKTTAGLSGYVENGELSEAGIRKACYVLSYFRQLLNNFQISSYYVFATASLRNVGNTEEAVRRIREYTGFSVDVLTGEEESRLGFIGVIGAVHMENGLFVDIGGGSTELAEFEGGEILRAESMPVGALNLFLKNVPGILPQKEAMKKIRAAAEEEIQKLNGFSKVRREEICASGGTARATRKLYNSYFELPYENTLLETRLLGELLGAYRKNGKAFSRRMLQLVPDRVHTLIPGMVILRTVAKGCGGKRITVSSCGVREGYLYSRVIQRGI